MKKSFIILFLLISLSISGKTYYIDPSGTDGAGVDGSTGTPWKTLDYACTRVTTPGDIIHVKAGVYTEEHVCELSVGVSIVGEGNTSHIICTYTAGVTAYTEASISLTSMVEGTNGNQSISYIKLDGSNLTATKAIVVRGRSNVKIHHVSFVNFENGAVYFSGNLGAAGGIPKIYATGNEIYNCTVDNCATRIPTHGQAPLGTGGHIRIAGQEGLLIHDNTFIQIGRATENGDIIEGVEGHIKGIKYYNNNSFMPANPLGQWAFHIEVWTVDGGFEIFNNEFHGGVVGVDNGGFGNVKGKYTYSMWIHDNLFELDAQKPYIAGDPTKVGVMNEGNNEYLIVNNNYFKNYPFGVYNVLPLYVVGQILMEHIYIYNNIFENIGYTNEFSAGVYVASHLANGIIKNIYIDNNIMIAGKGIPYAGIYFNVSCSFSYIYIRNNIIQGFYFAPIQVDGQGGTLDMIYVQNNLYYLNGLNGNSNNIGYVNGGSVTKLTESGNLNDNPDFVSATDFHLKPESPAIDAGLDLGKPYYGSDPDIGAFETVSGDPAVPEYIVSYVRNATPSIIEMNYNISLDPNSVPYTTDFSVLVNFAKWEVILVETEGSVVRLILENPVNNGDLVTVAYSQGSHPLQTIYGGKVVNMNPRQVINQVGVSDSQNKLTFKIYPNPAHDYTEILIIGEPPDKVLFVKIQNLSGISVYENSIEPGSIEPSYKIRIPIDFPPGPYILQIGSGTLIMFTQVLIVS